MKNFTVFMVNTAERTTARLTGFLLQASYTQAEVPDGDGTHKKRWKIEILTPAKAGVIVDALQGSATEVV